jgi:hypothetical protein
MAPAPAPVESVLVLDCVAEPLPSPPAPPASLFVLLWQAPIKAVPSTSAAANAEGFLINIMLESWFGMVGYTVLIVGATVEKTRIFY